MISNKGAKLIADFAAEVARKDGTLDDYEKVSNALYSYVEKLETKLGRTVDFLKELTK